MAEILAARVKNIAQEFERGLADDGKGGAIAGFYEKRRAENVDKLAGVLGL